MQTTKNILLVAVALGAASFSFAATSSAHISLEQAGTHKSRYGDGELKDAPCGRKDGTRGTNIYTYKPGETITIGLKEFIPHPSYFRIAFDQDGDDGFKEPASIKPIDPARKCPDGPADKCGESDFNNSPEVLMDDLNPHLAGQDGPDYTWDVELPNVTCDNCTVQVIQVMQDDAFHGPYNPFPGDPNDTNYVADNYHQCIDIVLSGPLAGGGPSGAPASSSDSGGCSVARAAPRTGFTSVLALLSAAALLGRRRRTR
jgi:MYXO-CTERM domain-containing protein